MMILQSEPADVRRAVTKLEFKAIDLSRDGELGDLFLDRECVDASSTRVEEIATVCKNEREIADELDAARHAGRREGREEVETECERKITEERTQVLSLSKNFQQERARYFSAVEAEVVKLALAIAARVLHREAKLDPVLLQAVVKIALKRVRDESGATLRVPIDDLQMWRELMLQDESCAVEVTGDSRLERGDCVLETRVGRVELGISVQIEEIERGFFDLLQLRPA